MAPYLALKALHVLAAMIFFGTGLGSAWYRLRADASGDLRVIAWCQREIVLADWLFTVPSAVLLPATAMVLVSLLKLPWTTSWILLGIGGYVLAGLLWLPAVWLQIEMRRLAAKALADGAPLPPRYRACARVWLALGIPSFCAALGTTWVMVAKHASF